MVDSTSLPWEPEFKLSLHSYPAILGARNSILRFDDSKSPNGFCHSPFIIRVQGKKQEKRDNARVVCFCVLLLRKKSFVKFSLPLRSCPCTYHCWDFKHMASPWLQGRLINHRAWLCWLFLTNCISQDCTYWENEHKWWLVAVYATFRLWRVIMKVKWKGMSIPLHS